MAEFELTDDLAVVSEIAEAGDGGVVLARDESNAGEEIAVKIIPRDGLAGMAGMNYLRREVMQMARLRHRHIIAFRDVQLSRCGSNILLLMDYGGRENLRNYIVQNG